MRELLFRGTVDEIDVGRLQEGLPARIKVGAIASAEVTGKLTRIAPQSRVKDGATVFDVEITLDPGQKTALRAGYSCNASIIIQEKKDVLLLPERVVFYEKGKEKATVEVPDPGAKSPKKVEIYGGYLRRPQRGGALRSQEGRQGAGEGAQGHELEGRNAARP